MTLCYDAPVVHANGYTRMVSGVILLALNGEGAESGAGFLRAWAMSAASSSPSGSVGGGSQRQTRVATMFRTRVESSRISSIVRVLEWLGAIQAPSLSCSQYLAATR